jgi:uncharacterized BrkB/YihY/UPF0761 family membrane protein
VATAVIAGTARHRPPGRVLALTLATLVVFWLAHVYAAALSHYLRRATRLRWATVTGAMAEEQPMLAAPAPSLLLLLLGALGVLGDQLAENLALWAGVAQLVGWGAAYAPPEMAVACGAGRRCGQRDARGGHHRAHGAPALRRGMGRLRRGRDRTRVRRAQLEVRLADGQARLERARARSAAVDTAVGMLRRERPVAVGILAAALAFRLFALLIPLAYVAVAGLGFAATAGEPGGPATADRLGNLVVESIASVAPTSDRGRWLALILGGAATLLAAVGVVEVLRWVHVLAWRVTPVRDRRRGRLALGLAAGAAVVFGVSAAAEWARAAVSGLGSELAVLLTAAAVQGVLLAVLWLALSWALPRPAVPWTALVPGALLFAGGFLGFSLAVRLYFVPRAARASAVYGSLGVALVLLVSLFLFGRLAVTAAELNATLWERRTQRRPPSAPPP